MILPTRLKNLLYKNVMARRFANFSLRRKLMIAFLLVVVITIVTVSFFNDRVLRAQLTQDVAETLQNLAATKAQAVGDFLAKEADTLEALSVNIVLQQRLEAGDEAGRAEAPHPNLEALDKRWRTAGNTDPLIRGVLENEASRELMGFRNTFPENSEVLLTDRYGVLVAATNRTDRYDYSGAEWWQAAYKEGRGSLYLGRTASGQEIEIAHPVYGRQSQIVVGVLHTILSLDTLAYILTLEEGLQGGGVDLYFPDGRLFLADFEGLRPQPAKPALLAALEQLRHQEETLYLALPYANETPSLVSQASVVSSDPGSRVKIKGLNWSVIAHQDRRLALQPVHTSLYTTLLTGLATLVAAGALAIVVTRFFSQPIIRLTEAVQQVADGNLTVQAPVETGDEIGTLAVTFNIMTAKLCQTLEEVRQANETISRRIVQLSTSNKVGQQVTSILDLDRLLVKVVSLIQKRFAYAFVGVWLVDDHDDDLVLHAMAGDVADSAFRPGSRLPLTTTTLMLPAPPNGRSDRPDDIHYNPDYLAGAALPQMQSTLAVPLRSGADIIGVLDIRSEEETAFNLEEDRLVLKILATQIAIAINNAKLYKLEQRRRHWAEALERAGRALTSNLDMQHVPNLVLEQLDMVTPYERGLVLLRRDSALHPIAHRGFPQHYNIGKLRLPIHAEAADIFQKVVAERTWLIIDDVTVEPSWHQLAWLPENRSWLGAPLISKNKVVGLVSLTRPDPAAFSREDGALVQAFAGQAAIALENAKLYREIKQLNEHLEEKVQERTEALNQAYHTLERLDQAKADFINITSHELRTPLTVIKGYSQVLKVTIPSDSGSNTKELLDGILDGTDRMHEIVNRMLDVSKIDQEMLSLHSGQVHLDSVIERVQKHFHPTFENRRLTFCAQALDSLPPIQADKELLGKVFYQLIGNAIKYTPDGGRVVVEGRLVEDLEQTTWVEIMIRDSGIGIEPDQLELIFEKFYQTGEVALHSSGKTKFKGGGPGLGLALAKGIILAHGGKIWAESEGHDEDILPGSKFLVRLPVDGRDE